MELAFVSPVTHWKLEGNKYFISNTTRQELDLLDYPFPYSQIACFQSFWDFEALRVRFRLVKDTIALTITPYLDAFELDCVSVFAKVRYWLFSSVIKSS